ncbi:ATP-dependent nuclease [Halobacillus ihumii]|uniref:ATP-dependent nuclease n=1 Tax=Halobacillus ihumii TaxID=2686092 RepID=UPI0013D145FA|nr:AAA family ATPase [Halobacillus ihumii]
MDFFVTSYFYNLVKIPNTFPSVVLSNDNWNDNNYYTLFKLFYFDENKNEFNIGEVKILHEESKSTRLEKHFKTLTSAYCSLGQDISYYEKLRALGKEVALDILKNLNDAAINPSIYDEFKDNEGFTDSLIRFSQAEKALREANNLYFDVKIEKILNFDFTYKLPSAIKPHEFRFDFEADKHLPYRINAIIGKNGTGKTQILSKIAALISGYEKNKEQNFHPKRPSFSKVIAISYSAFDEFDRPSSNDRTFSYEYCGIRDDTNTLMTSDEIKNKIKNTINVVLDKAREDVWYKVLEEIIEQEHRHVLYELIDGKDVSLSSGQSLIIMTMTEVIANIEEESLLLFDEPETHLHPNALANLIRMFNRLLLEFNSFAILSTHSPIITQEIPANYINVVERIENTPIVRKLPIESFGENISTITNDIFDVRSTESNYKSWFKKMAEVMSYEEILNVFNNSLSYNAMTYLNTLYKEEDKS